MKTRHIFLATLAASSFAAADMAQAAAPQDAPDYLLLAQARQARGATPAEDAEQLKISALEALMAAPAARAFPLVKKVLEGEHSEAVKSRALFVLSQISGAEAEALLLGMATDDSFPLQAEAIRMVGIGGSTESLRRLGPVYRAGNPELRRSVLNAYLIAGDATLVFEIARDAKDAAEFDAAVETLGAMQASAELRSLYEKGSDSNGIIRAYAIAGDLESLSKIAVESKNPEQRTRAIRNIGIIDGEAAGTTLLEIYRDNSDAEIREAALHGLLVNGHDVGVMALFRESADSAEKRRLLRTLVNMNSDLALDLIDSTLEGGSR